MSLFKRRKGEEAADADAVVDAVGTEPQDADGEPADDVRDDAGDAAAAGEPAGTFDRSGGPFDLGEVDDLEGRLDIGAIKLPLVEGIELQLQMDEDSGQVTGAFIVLGDAAVQVQAFAAPRSEGIWRDVCSEIAAGITEQGGTADPGYGRFGRELLARVPAQQPDGKVGFQPLRFTGVDGPRWMLRGVFHGRAAIEPEHEVSRLLEAVVAGIVVDRGVEPMGPRELLPLRLPAVAGEEGGPGEAPAAEGGDHLERIAQAEEPAGFEDLQPFRRGPEITESR